MQTKTLIATLVITLALVGTTVMASYPDSFESKAEMQQLINDRVGTVTPNEFIDEMRQACYNAYDVGTGEEVSTKFGVYDRKRTFIDGRMTFVSDPTSTRVDCKAWIRTQITPTYSRVYSYTLWRVSYIDVTEDVFEYGRPYFSRRANGLEFLI